MPVTPPPAGRDPVEVVAAITERDGRLLVTRRTEAQTFPGLWEFPGGKVEPGETASDALARELREELGVAATARAEYECVRYRNSAGRSIHVRFFLTEPVEGNPEPLEVAEVRWVEAAELRRLDFIPHDEAVAHRLADDLEAGRL